MTQGSKFISSLLLLKEVADPIFGNNDFQDWVKRKYLWADEFFEVWNYINALEITNANASSIVGIVSKQNWFSTFYTNWKFMQADGDFNNKITLETAKKINNTIEEIKTHLDNENIVY